MSGSERGLGYWGLDTVCLTCDSEIVLETELGICPQCGEAFLVEMDQPVRRERAG